MYDQTIKTLLTEEKWTRATISNYSISNFQELDTFLSSLANNEEKIEVKELCDEHLHHTRTSIVALYISGVLAIERNAMDDSNLSQLIELFMDNRKWNIVEFLAKKILSYAESSYALKALAEFYEENSKEDEKFKTWERLVKVDYEEVDILKLIAARYAEQGETRTAVSYYKKAVQRYLHTNNFNGFKDTLAKLMELDKDDFDYYFGLIARLQMRMGDDRAIIIAYQLFDLCNDAVDKRIMLLKYILDLDIHDAKARTLLVAAYEEKYANHSRLQSCLDKSGLLQGYRDIHAAIDEFERDISFDKGTFVFHNTWNIGRINEITADKVTIDFVSKRNHTMSINMASSSLMVLPKSHIWVLKSAIAREKLVAKITEDVPWALRTLITSNAQGAASLKEMKAELVPSLLTASQWTTWNNQAKKILMNDPLFGVSALDSDLYVVRSTPISYEEKQLNIFKGERNFYQKIKILREFISGKGDVESDTFLEMVRYFSEQISASPVTDFSISSYLIIDELAHRKYKLSFVTQDVTVTFESLYEKMSDHVSAIFRNIEDSELKKAFVDKVIEVDEKDWRRVLIELFPYYLTSYIPDKFNGKKNKGIIIDLMKEATENYREMPDIFLYFFRTADKKTWEVAQVSEEKLILTAIQMLDYSFKIAENRKDTENKKNNKQLMTILFDEYGIRDFIRKSSREAAQSIYSLVQKITQLDPAKKLEIRHEISVRFPDFTFVGDDDRQDPKRLIPTGLLVTQASLDAKLKELDHIMNVEIPENSKEIGLAREQGDLRENSEYQYGKEKQELLSSMVKKLSDEIGKAQVITPDMVDPSKISFGTKAVLHDNIENRDIVYSIMGPWESDPENNIINLHAPLGSKLLNLKAGEQTTFKINEKEYDFTVVSIEKLKF